jgi:hypothetical protein
VYATTSSWGSAASSHLGADRILRVNVTSKEVKEFAESINGADGIAFASKGRLWVAANQADEVVRLNSRGRIVERVGSFQGVGRDGAAKGLLFPASIVISRGDIYVTNLALPLTPAPDRAGDEPEEDVSTYTVSRFQSLTNRIGVRVRVRVRTHSHPDPDFRSSPSRRRRRASAP